MSLSDEQVNEIAHLARLQVDGDAVPDYARNLSDILSFVETMSAVDTSGVEPLAHPLEMPQRLREDAVTEENQRERFQAIAPQVEAGLYLVPRVIE
ncbi:Asp-tRNA(Asn)/Glu-tRNA(Gln) amidotransferase subunit GatC [Aquisalimonas sp. 2447]|uniref:Asp-tRNA(Asn)/Glu-tRNA(Gln) amidotransferase subunit GatC n=1 Tax=Aquisalimonas sp. 2447 TaxID=2740807 RepID=UPI00143265E3|nr:Asp-tRNA(Asn)/Glu-tRNA(Gln) amidotransferase subunit GatC [Aquisalimonas sp. 2447]QIT56442.1 Asp-tRNA(Asn)/Glu-tRNA(Gln) amidotransferase subunit GatC [Aquisalimonas sp. 2447]